jgi:hypothetical protein
MLDDINGIKKNQLAKKAVSDALKNPETYATVLHAILLTCYGEDIYTWPSTEIYQSLKEDFEVWPIEELENKIQAIITAVDTDDFYTDVDTFRAITFSLLTGDPEFDSMSELSLPEVFWAIYEVGINREVEDELSDEVRRLISREIDQEADDSPFDDEMKPSYVTKALSEFKNQLASQLKAVGFTNISLPSAT